LVGTLEHILVLQEQGRTAAHQNATGPDKLHQSEGRPISAAGGSHQDVGVHNDSATFFHIIGDINMTLLMLSEGHHSRIEKVKLFGRSLTVLSRPSRWAVGFAGAGRRTRTTPPDSNGVATFSLRPDT
jgi:hypothetical protein